jgi:hypothetical protein
VCEREREREYVCACIGPSHALLVVWPSVCVSCVRGRACARCVCVSVCVRPHVRVSPWVESVGCRAWGGCVGGWVWVLAGVCSSSLGTHAIHTGQWPVRTGG